jgi:hypothetical protein
VLLEVKGAKRAHAYELVHFFVTFLPGVSYSSLTVSELKNRGAENPRALALNFKNNAFPGATI